MQTTYRGKSPNIAKGLGNDGLLSDLTRLLGDDRGFGRGYPSNEPRANPFSHKPDHHYQRTPQQYHKPYTKDPSVYSNTIKPPILQAHKPYPPVKVTKNLGNVIENSIGGAFYDPKHDMVVSYKVR